MGKGGGVGEGSEVLKIVLYTDSKCKVRAYVRTYVPTGPSRTCLFLAWTINVSRMFMHNFASSVIIKCEKENDSKKLEGVRRGEEK